MLEELVNRRKLPGKTMTTYFHRNLSLCERVDVTEETAVSCIIKGSPIKLHANAYATLSPTPEAPYSGFYAGLEGYSSPAKRREARSTPSQPVGEKRRAADPPTGDERP